MCALVRKTIRQAKRDDWHKFCSSINSGSDTASVWKKIGKINHSKMYRAIPTLKMGDNQFVTDLDKANVLADTFAAVSSNGGYSPEFCEIKEEEEAKFYFKNDSESLLDEPFTINELDEAIEGAKCTSPGKDDINMVMVKHLPLSAKKILLIIFNYIWHVSQCPVKWKEAVLTPLLKPGKEACNPSSYRPIALTSTLCKTMERMVNKRLLWFLESHSLLGPIQSGFRKGRRTNDHLVALESSINRGFSNSESTVAVFLDISKAYDMVWRKGAVIKLQMLGIGGKMVKWVDDFLNNRSIQIRVNGILSSTRVLENGVPQGSVISPLIFNIMVNDIPSVIKNVRISQFADDIALWKTGRNVRYIADQIQQNIDRLVGWCKQWGFKLSTPKTVGMLFTHKKCKPKISLKLDGINIKFEPYAKFLGLFFDQRLTWEKHIDYIVGKCKTRINLLRCISGLDWGVDGKLLYNLYRALIGSVLEYGCESFASASKSVLAKLDSVQYQSLKICAGAICRTSLAKLQVECGDPPLHLRRVFLTQCYSFAIRSRHDHPNQHLLSDSWQKHYFVDKWSSGDFHTPFEGRSGPVDKKVFDSGYIPFPYWHLQRVNVSLDIHDLLDDNKESWMMREIAIKHINGKLGSMLHIYTDGSVDVDKGAVGCGIYIPQFKYVKGYRLPAGISIFSAELIALLMATEWIQDVKPLDTCILSDSMSALQAISVFNPSNKIVWEIQHAVNCLKVQGIYVCFEWVPSHCGIAGNECVDLVAKKAADKKCIDIDLPFSMSEFKSDLKINLKKCWQEKWNSYASNEVIKNICPRVGFRMVTWKCNRREETIMHRLRLGVCYGLNHYRFLINKHPDGRCEVCGCKDTVAHLLLECKKYDHQRAELFDSVAEMGLKDLSLVGLLGGCDAPYKDVIKFIKGCHIII
jgi:ribonuclease HI